MQKKIKAYLIRTDRKTGQSFRGTFEEIVDELEVMQRFVNYDKPDGTIAIVSLGDIKIIHEDNGKAREFPVSRFCVDDSSRVVDVFVGNLILCRANLETGELADIQKSDLYQIHKYLLPPLQMPDGKYLALPHESWLPDYQEGYAGRMFIRKQVSVLEMMFPTGTKLRITEDIQDPYTPKKAGDIFTVDYIDDVGNIHGSWASGGSISLIYGKDKFEVVEE